MHSVRRMAERDARAHLLRASFDVCVRLEVDVVTCPRCGAGEDSFGGLPLRGDEPGWDWAAPSGPRPTLRLLGCESVTARSLLPLAVAAHVRGSGVFQTRAATLPEPPLDDNAVPAALRRLDLAERWADQLHDPEELERWQGAMTLPVAVTGTSHGPHFLSPHGNTPFLRRLNERYLRDRLRAVKLALGR